MNAQAVRVGKFDGVRAAQPAVVYAALFAVGLALNLVVAATTATPPVMDSYEYFNGAWLLARGAGLEAPYVWNYLDGAQGLPTANFTYWMPLPALIAAPFVWLAGPTAPNPALQPELLFWASLPMAALGALVPVLAAATAWHASARTDLAWLAGVLALATGLYVIRWSNVDSYAPFAVSAAAAFGAVTLGDHTADRRWWIAAGVLAGLAHLTRADGVLVPATIVLWGCVGLGQARRMDLVGAFLLAYGLTLAPWLLRNLMTTGSPLGLGGARTLWALDYDELFSLDPTRLTLARYMATDLSAQVSAKIAALSSNLATLWIAQGQVLMLPLALVGAWRWRRSPLVQMNGLFGVLLLLALSFAFTYPGPRGAFLHSGGALVPVLAAGGALGLDQAVSWAARRRGWVLASARPVFLGAALMVQVAAGAALAFGRPLGDSLSPLEAYARADALLPPGAGAAVVNPPAFYYHTGRPAIVIPDGPVADLAAAVDRFGLRYVVLDGNHAAGLLALYENPDKSVEFRLLAPLNGEGEAPVWLLERQPPPSEAENADF